MHAPASLGLALRTTCAAHRALRVGANAHDIRSRGRFIAIWVLGEPGREPMRAAAALFSLKTLNISIAENQLWADPKASSAN